VRIRIKTNTKIPCQISFNYQKQLKNSIENAIIIGINKMGKNLEKNKKLFISETFIKNKLYTYSKFFLFPRYITNSGFAKVTRAEMIFSTPLSLEYSDVILNIFKNGKYYFEFEEQKIVFKTTRIDILPEKNHMQNVYLTLKSPLTTGISFINKTGDKTYHFYNYMNENEREDFKNKLVEVLCKKYELFYNKKYNGSKVVEFQFDPSYLSKKNGKISKLITFEENIKIKSFESPFLMKADHRLIKFGYDCGFGMMTDFGFGCVDYIKE